MKMKIGKFWQNTMERKGVAKNFIYILLILLILSQNSIAQNKYNVIRDWNQYKNAANFLYENLSNQAFAQLTRRVEEIKGISSEAGWEQRKKEVRDKFKKVIGDFPEKTPLNARVLKKIKKEDYSVEDIVYESRPGYYVTSSLFIPARLKGKAPAILNCIGHTDISYQAKGYQHIILNLVKKGFIVFVFDPIGQGERIQYYDSTTDKSLLGGPTIEHSYPGAQVFITGNSLANYMIWDGIRAVDYLLTRKEVDPNRIGITGISGGGTQSAYIAAFDDRIYAAAPENYITSFKRLLQSIGPQDAEQNMFHEIAQGLDHADLLEVRAPKPTLMVTTTRDFFSIQGSIETAKEVSKVFETYGRTNYFRMVEDDTGHNFTRKNSEAIYAFFQKYLNNPGDSTDLNLEPLEREELQATSTGQLATTFRGESIFSLNEKEANNLIGKIQLERRDLTSHLSNVLFISEKLSGYIKPKKIHNSIFTGRYKEDGYVMEKYFVRGAGDYVIPYLIFRPQEINGKAIILLNPLGKSMEVSNNDFLTFVKKGYIVMVPDLLGTGELGNGYYRGDSFIGNTSYGIWYLSILIGRSIAGVQASDLSRLVNILKTEFRSNEIYGVALRDMAPVLTLAAAHDPNITRVALIEPYVSYSSVVMNKFYKPQFVFSAIPGALKSFDLPDLEACLAPRKLSIVKPTDGNGKTLSESEATSDLSFVKTAYNKKNGEFILKTGEEMVGGNLGELLEEWLK